MHVRSFIKFSLSLIFLLFFITVNQLFADHNQYIFEQANQLYQQDKFEQAILAYDEIRRNGYENWELYYNLANAYFKAGELGKSIVNFERAFKLNPKNEDILFNLEFVNTRTVDNIPTPPLTKMSKQIKHFISLKTLTWLTLGIYFLFILSITLRIIIRGNRWYKFLRILIIPVALVFIFSAALFLINVREDATVHYAILISEKVDVLGSPTEDGTILFSLHEGVKFKVEEIRIAWAKIRLADGNVGWIKKDVFEII